MLGGLDRVEPTLRARRPLSLAFYHPTLLWSGWVEPNVLQTRPDAALVWAVGLIFYNPTLQWARWPETLYTPTLPQLLQWAVSLVPYNPILQWSEGAEYNVLQPHSAAALQWAGSNV